MKEQPFEGATVRGDVGEAGPPVEILIPPEHSKI